MVLKSGVLQKNCKKKLQKKLQGHPLNIVVSDTFLPILKRLVIDADEWIENTQNFEMIFYKKFYYQRNTA